MSPVGVSVVISCTQCSERDYSSSAPPTSPANIAASHSPSAPLSTLGTAAFEFLSEPVFVFPPVTVATEPTVALGAWPSCPFIAVAVPESVAKPTDAGFARKTE